MDCTGIIELKLIKGTVDLDLFFDFVRGDLLPQLQQFDGTNPHSVVILDDCTIHHVESIHEFFEASGVLLLFLPPYSPDLMPIEEAFSSVWRATSKDMMTACRQLMIPFPLSEQHFSPLHLSSVKPGLLMLDILTTHTHVITHKYNL